MARILLVDDDVDHLGVMAACLTQDAHTVDAAVGGLEGWERIQNNEYDLIILDWDMPDLAGIEVLKRYAAVGGTAPILMLTGRAEIDDKAEGLDSGAADYLTKPFHVKELMARVRAILRTAEQRNPKQQLAMLTHDLKSPLTSIGLSMELVVDMHADSLPEPVRKTLIRTQSEVKRLSRMAATLLDVEKMDSGELTLFPSSCSCSDVVEPAMGAVAALADRKQITLIEVYETDLLFDCDKDRTIQVLVNFLSNAIKFSPERSAIRVRAAMAKQGRIRFEVFDEGPGISENEIEELFAKFRQLDQDSQIKKQGSGLGLYICKRLIAAQGGDIGYSSPGATGSCFWFELPVASA
jgi:signal transduction histidine kinase